PDNPGFRFQVAPSGAKRLWLPFQGVIEKRADIAAGRFDAEAEELNRTSEPADEPTTEQDSSDTSTAENVHKLDLDLVVQSGDYFCAPAASKMILDEYPITPPLTQDQIAQKMGDLEVIKNAGALPEEQ